MIRVFIADDHSLIREGLKKIIDAEPDMTVVGLASNSYQVYSFLGSDECDVISMDITMPGKTGLEVLQDIVKEYPNIKVLMLSMHPNERFAMRSFKLGAYGYLTKETAVENIVRAIRTLYSGNKFMTNDLVNSMILGMDEDDQSSPDNLSNREFQVFLKLAAGKTVTETANELSLSQSTINTYRSRILEKMGLSSNMDLIHYAIKNHLVE